MQQQIATTMEKAIPIMIEKPTDPRIDIARRNLRILCAMRETNFSEVARQAGLGRNALSQFLGGKSALTYPNMLKICDVLRVPIGLLHRPEPITEQRIRLARILERLPDHLAGEAMAEAAKWDNQRD